MLTDTPNYPGLQKVYFNAGQQKKIQRDLQIFTALSHGATIPETAEVHGISPRTVEAILVNWRKRLELPTATSLIAYLIRNGHI